MTNFKSLQILSLTFYILISLIYTILIFIVLNLLNKVLIEEKKES